MLIAGHGRHPAPPGKVMKICAGTIGSAQLLMTAGIGPALHLRDFGIEVVIDAPGVGQNLQDHPMTSVVFQASEAAIAAVRARAINSFNAMVRTDPAAAEPDILLVFGDGAYFSPALNGPSDAYVILPTLVKPASRGSVRLASRDITVPPLIDPNFLGDQAGRPLPLARPDGLPNRPVRISLSISQTVRSGMAQWRVPGAHDGGYPPVLTTVHAVPNGHASRPYGLRAGVNRSRRPEGNNVEFPYPAGKVLDGSSSINGTFHLRGHRALLG